MGSYDGPFKFLLAKIPLYNTYLLNCSPILCFGPGIGLGAYYVQAQRISWEAFWGTLPFGIMLFSMITINEIPDYFEDRRGGKLNLVGRFGREKGVWLFTLSLISAYGAILAGVILKRIPFLGLISLLTLPIAYLKWLFWVLGKSKICL